MGDWREGEGPRFDHPLCATCSIYKVSYGVEAVVSSLQIGKLRLGQDRYFYPRLENWWSQDLNLGDNQFVPKRTLATFSSVIVILRWTVTQGLTLSGC